MTLAQRFHAWRYRVWHRRYYRACFKLARLYRRRESHGFYRRGYGPEVDVRLGRVMRCEERMLHHKYAVRRCRL
jgi:hypothetical protein